MCAPRSEKPNWRTAHAGHVEVLAKFVDFLGNETEVFGDEGEFAEHVFEALEKLQAGGLDPLAVDGGLLFGGDGPEGFEAAEVIEADRVVEGQAAADACDPPIEAALP